MPINTVNEPSLGCCCYITGLNPELRTFPLFNNACLWNTASIKYLSHGKRMSEKMLRKKKKKKPQKYLECKIPIREPFGPEPHGKCHMSHSAQRLRTEEEETHRNEINRNHTHWVHHWNLVSSRLLILILPRKQVCYSASCVDNALGSKMQNVT